MSRATPKKEKEVDIIKLSLSAGLLQLPLLALLYLPVRLGDDWETKPERQTKGTIFTWLMPFQ